MIHTRNWATIQARDTVVSFEELNEKLLSRRLNLLPEPLHPATAFPANSSTRRSSNTLNRPVWQNQQPRSPVFQQQTHPSSRFQQHTLPSTGSCQYHGKCQLCGVQGHSAHRCLEIQSYVPSSKSVRQPAPPVYTSHSAHSAASPPSDANWILDSSASHHITTDLANLSLHAPYEGHDGVLVGDGEGQLHGGCPPSGSTR